MKKLLKASSIYVFSTILVSIIPFLLIPVMTRYLTKEEYGQVAMFQILVSAMSAIVGFSVYGAANRKYFDQDVSQQTLQKFNGACFHILLTSTFVFLIILIFIKEWIAKHFDIPPSWILVALVVSFTSFVVQIRLGQWQIREKAKLFGIFQIIQSLLNAILSIVFVVVLLKGAQGRIDAQMFVMLLFTLISVYLLYRDKLVVLFQWNPILIREALSFGIPLVPHVVGGFLLLSVDRIVINEKLGLAEVGIYMLAVQLSSVLKIIFHSINKAYSPWLFGELKTNNEKTKIQIVKLTYLYFLCLLFISGLIFLFGPFFVVLIAGSDYQNAGPIIGYLCLGNIFNGMYLMVANYIFYSKKTFRLSLVTVSSGVINIILLFLLIEPYGLVGAGIAFAVSNFVMFLLAWITSSKSHNMPWFSALLK
ncbi:MAG: O-antigen/teichoic acid export membrane protein [Colwellia sp.]|jgi:O-antigen/teichoic acid export membrane protein